MDHLLARARHAVPLRHPDAQGVTLGLFVEPLWGSLLMGILESAWPWTAPTNRRTLKGFRYTRPG
uniref:hypothetical protein n=1 Tax=Candidatus Electrothrix sp. TaxID=2170559 RepID=UPI0040569DF4